MGLDFSKPAMTTVTATAGQTAGSHSGTGHKR